MPATDNTSLSAETTHHLTNTPRPGLLARLVQRYARWRRGAPLDCELCLCPTGMVVHFVILCPAATPNGPS